MATNREKVVDIAKKWLGFNEADGSHKQIISVYNNHRPLAQGYAVKYYDAWCATFVSAVMIKAGLTKIAPTECSCPRMIKLYEKLGRWVESDSYVPKPGDIVMYDWQDGGSGDNRGNPDHVGIVVEVSNGSIRVIEGNMNNAVGYRTLKVNDRYIRGYCCPDYEGAGSVAAGPDEIDITIQNAVKDIKLVQPDLWEDVLRGKIKPTPVQVKALMDKYHAAVEKR